MKMESLNMSKLNLSSVRASSSKDITVNPQAVRMKHESNYTQIDPNYEYQCEYREEIWKNLLEQETERAIIHLQSPQLEFRGTLVQQLRDISKKLGLSIATLHSAVAHLDLFMDAHRLRADRLTHVAIACLSLAAKSEEKCLAPTLITLSEMSGVQLCGKTFKQLEWMIGQHVRWRLLAPTPVTFASLLTQYVVAESDLTTRNPKFVRRFRSDGVKLLEAYLDMTLADVRLKVLDSVDVGCACVACARADLGLNAWPPWLATLSSRKPTTVAPITRLLQRMMQVKKSRETTVDLEADQGYSSARTSPNQTPCTSPQYHVSPPTTYTTSNYLSVANYPQQPGPDRLSVLDLDDNNAPTNVQTYYTIPTPVDMTCQRVDNHADYRYCRSRRMLEASLASQPSTSAAVKRGLEPGADIEVKRYRLTTPVSQVVL